MLNLTNYFDHPGDNRYTVFRFVEEEHANHFEELLIEQNIDFERHTELDDSGDIQILFGISKRYYKDAVRCNFITHAAYRKPFIGNHWLKLLLLGFTLLLILLAIVGYLKQAG